MNPYVTLVTGGTLGSRGVPTLQTPFIVVPGVPGVDANGTVYVSAAPPSATPCIWEEEEASDQERAQALHDEWLREMEVAAQVQWAALRG